MAESLWLWLTISERLYASSACLRKVELPLPQRTSIFLFMMLSLNLSGYSDCVFFCSALNHPSFSLMISDVLILYMKQVVYPTLALCFSHTSSTCHSLHSTERYMMSSVVPSEKTASSPSSKGERSILDSAAAEKILFLSSNGTRSAE